MKSIDSVYPKWDFAATRLLSTACLGVTLLAGCASAPRTLRVIDANTRQGGPGVGVEPTPALRSAEEGPADLGGDLPHPPTSGDEAVAMLKAAVPASIHGIRVNSPIFLMSSSVRTPLGQQMPDADYWFAVIETDKCFHVLPKGTWIDTPIFGIVVRKSDGRWFTWSILGT